MKKSPKLNYILMLHILCNLHFACVSKSETVAWFYALEQDKPGFEALVGPPIRSTKIGATTITEYKVGTHTLVSTKMGSGCVVTATNVATVMAVRAPTRIISTGPAGALSPDLPTGTWLRCEQVCGWQSGKAEDDQHLVLKASETLPFEPVDWPVGKWSKFDTVQVASGEAFISGVSARASVQANTSAKIVEMNLFGLVGALHERKTKMLVLRVVSDHANEAASTDFSNFAKSYDGSGGKMVAEILRALPASADEPSSYEELRRLLNK